MKKQTRTALLLLCVLMAAFCAKSFVINPDRFVGKGSAPAASSDIIWTFVALGFAALFIDTYLRRGYRAGLGQWLFGLFFGVANYFGVTLFAFDSWLFVGRLIGVGTVALKCLGQGLAMTAALTWISGWLRSPRRELEPLRLHGLWARLHGFYTRRPTLALTALLAVCYLPFLIIFYPGVVISDMAWMFEQFEGITQMTTWHSVFTTWTFALCVRFGRLFGSDNLGCCLYMALQTGLLCYAVARSLSLMRRLGSSRRWQLAGMAFFCLTPIWGTYCIMLGKDTLFTATVLLWLVQTVEWARGLRRWGPGRWALYALTALLICLWRNNGLYLALPCLLVFVLALARRGDRLRMGGVAAGVLAVMLAFDNLLVPALGIVDNRASGVYSLPFQQVARVVRNHREELTPQQLEAIDQVLDVDEIGALYEPWISDPVKYTYRQFGQGAQVEKQALAGFRQVWLELLPTYWQTYVEAFVANTRGYYCFIPRYTGVTYSMQAGRRFYFGTYTIEGEGQLHTTQPQSLSRLRDLVQSLCERWDTIPLLQILLVSAAYTWLLIGAGIACAQAGRRRDVWLFLPALMSLATCLLSPVDDYFRYFLPIVAMTPLLLCLARHEKNRAQED